MSSWLTGRTALYRLYDVDDVLLYVGITHDPDERMAHHESQKPWWPQVVRHAVVWFDTRSDAQAAELEAIRTEQAVYNVTGSPWAPQPRVLAPHERPVGEVRNELSELIKRAQYLGESVVIVDRKRERKPIAVLVSVDFYERAVAALDGRSSG